MSSRHTVSALLIATAWAAGASAQAPDLEPGVQTSEPPPSAATSPPPALSSGPPPAAQPVLKAKPRTGASGREGAAPAKTQDRIELDTTQISGNRELPKVMYVVPWRKADLGDFAGRPPNSLLDEALTPVDRDVFRRQNRYFAALEADAAGSKPQTGATGSAGAGTDAKVEK